MIAGYELPKYMTEKLEVRRRRKNIVILEEYDGYVYIVDICLIPTLTLSIIQNHKEKYTTAT